MMSFPRIMDFFSRRQSESTPGIMRAAAQYNVADKIIDLCTFDVTNNPWRCGELFDAIITDPPCKNRTMFIGGKY